MGVAYVLQRCGRLMSPVACVHGREDRVAQYSFVYINNHERVYVMNVGVNSNTTLSTYIWCYYRKCRD